MRRPEQDLQKQVVRYLDLAYPALVYWHTPNGGARSAVEAGILKGIGVKAGIPDLTFILPDGRAAFVELKAGKGALTEHQKAFKARAEALECPFAEIRSLSDLADLLSRWLLPYGWAPRIRLAA